SFKLMLPSELRQRGTHPGFHSSLLRIHVPNDDRRFPGRQLHQILGFGEKPTEWEVDKIIAHSGKGPSAIFHVLWKSGDKTWLPYVEVKHLDAVTQYLEAMGVQS
ncbi:hypothetical protein BD410DRAFT_689985, partial [Rickenella mellea]